jgi:hypothetical protein
MGEVSKLISSLTEITADLETFLGACAHELCNQMSGMCRTNLIEFADCLAVIHSYMNGDQEERESSENLLTPDEVEEILNRLEVEIKQKSRSEYTQ